MRVSVTPSVALEVDSQPTRSTSPWKTTSEAADYLRFTSTAKNPVAAFRKFAAKHGLTPSALRGDIPLFHVADLDKAVQVRKAK